MIKEIKRRAEGVPMRTAIPAAVLAAVVVVVALLSTHVVRLPFGSTANHSSSPPSASQGSTLSPAGTSALTTAATLQLAAQDLTPSTHLGLTASGFQSGEQLNVTIEDAQGNTYEQAPLHAGKDGRLLQAPVALPQQLASGTYEILVVGDTSHRTAHATFRMHDEPPSIALDTYTSTPGQTIGFTGSGFIAGENVKVSLGTGKTPLATVQATDTGAVSGQVKVPALAPGNYTLTLMGSLSQTPASVGFNIQGFSPWVVLNHYAVTPGQGVGFIGQGFAPSEDVLVYLNSPQGQPVLRVTADPSGRIVVQDSWVPSGVDGRNELTFVGQVSKATTTADFTLLLGTAPTPTTPTTP